MDDSAKAAEKAFSWLSPADDVFSCGTVEQTTKPDLYNFGAAIGVVSFGLSMDFERFVGIVRDMFVFLV